MSQTSIYLRCRNRAPDGSTRESSVFRHIRIPYASTTPAKYQSLPNLPNIRTPAQRRRESSEMELHHIQKRRGGKRANGAPSNYGILFGAVLFHRASPTPSSKGGSRAEAALRWGGCFVPDFAEGLDGLGDLVDLGGIGDLG